MIAEQLQIARAAHWRQNQSPLLTLDDAQHWFQQHPLCLYLPRHAQLPAPAPSFVEACVGSRQTMPGAEAIEQAKSLLVRLVAGGSVVPLNLLGTVSEQPDFLAHTDALPFVLSLRADSDWKHAPQKSSGHKVSPLVLELWKTLEKDGAMTAIEAREALGRELTEAAVLRGLSELWQSLRLSPVFSADGEPARWEMLSVRHRAALTAATSTGQVTALSLLVSMYLQSVYAASSDEIEIFLSPVASRSRVREAVRGLAATRQIQSLSMDAQTYYFLEGGLPEFAEVPAALPAIMPASASREPRRPMPAPRKVQATRPAGAPEALPASAPIFRRPKPAAPPPPQPAPVRTRPAAPAYARSTRPQGRPAGAQSPGARSPRPPASDRPREFKPRGPRQGADARPVAGRRPPAGPNARPSSRPSSWKAAPRQVAPKPWALPGRKANAPSRPPRPGGRSGVPFRPRTAREDGAGAGAPRPRPPYQDRGQRPAGPAADRPKNPRFGPQPDGSGYRPNDRPRTPRPAAGQSSRPNARPNARPNTRPNTRPGTGAGRGPDARERPRQAGTGRPSGGASGPPRGTGQRGSGERPRPAGRPSFSSKPRPGGGPAREGGRPSGGPRPPAAPGGPPRKPGFTPSKPRSGGAFRKPGKPAGFRDRKPDRKKPGA